jgi:hypothetical protein
MFKNGGRSKDQAGGMGGWQTGDPQELTPCPWEGVGKPQAIKNSWLAIGGSRIVIHQNKNNLSPPTFFLAPPIARML